MSSKPHTDLQPITPRDAVERFLSRREADNREATVASYRRRLRQFVRFCEGRELLNLNELSGRDLQEYWDHRRPDLGDSAISNEFQTLKSFLEFTVAIEGVEPHLPDTAGMLKPTLTKAEQANTLKLPTDRAEAILDHLDTFAYASRDHAMLLLMWTTAARVSGLRALDVDDFDSDDGTLLFEHRDGTALKNGAKSTRVNVLSAEVVEVLEDYLRVNRIDQTDENGREPLLTTERGRMAKNTLRRRCYTITHPCFAGDCPHEEYDPKTCEFLDHGHQSKCPSAMSPHRIRTGAISHLRDQGVPIHVVAERVDATPETLRAHYDFSDERKRAEARREHFEVRV